MKSVDIIQSRLNNPSWIPGKYSDADWFNQKLIDLGFIWDDDTPPHYKLSTNDFRITVSPFSNVVILCQSKRSFEMELYCHPRIPKNEDEFNEFFESIKKLI